MIKRILFGTLFLLLFLGTLVADSGVLRRETLFIPREYYVGDEVELRITLQVEAGKSLRLPEILPESSWVDFHSVEIVGTKARPEIRIVFTSFIPGTRTLPPLLFGDIELNTVKIHTSSLVDSSETEFVGIAGQVLLPGTRIMVSLFAGLLFLGPISILVLLGPFRRKIKELIEISRNRQPFRRLSRKLKELEEQRDRISCRSFYIRLSMEVREYLSRRSSVDFTTLTTADMSFALFKVVKDKETSDKIFEMMKLADAVKFGGETTNDSRKLEDLVLVRKMCTQIESEVVQNSKSRRKQG